MDRAPLPDLNNLDRDALVAMVLAHQVQLASQQDQLRSLQAELDSHRQTVFQQAEELRSRIEHMKLMIEKLRRMMFGAKSEKIVIQLEQLEFELEDMETTQAQMEAVVDRVSPVQEKARPERKPLPEHLTRDVVTHVPERDCCPDCGGQLRQFGEDVSEQLEYLPHSFKVIRHVRPKFSCNRCDRVVEAPAPSRPIERGLAGPSLLAHVIVFEVQRSSASVQVVGDLCTSGRRDFALHAGRLGWRGERSAWPAGRRDPEACTRRPQAARRRYAYAGALSWQRQDENRTALDLCAGRQTCQRRYRAGSLVYLLGRPKGRTSTPAFEELQGRSPGRRVCRLSSPVR
jgi:hypothetical protein